MDDRAVRRLGAASAVTVATLSVVYAIAYLVVTPTAQRESDVDAFFRSYLADPFGLRLASVCLAVSGLAAGFAVVVLAAALDGARRPAVAWAGVLGAAAGLATAVHGFGDLLEIDRLAHRYADGDAATRAAVDVAHALPSPVDPSGFATFLVAGGVAWVFGTALRRTHPALGNVGIAVGVDLVVLFAATAAGVDWLVLLTGAIAAVVLGPVWWLGVARHLWAPEALGPRTVPPVSDALGMERRPVARTA